MLVNFNKHKEVFYLAVIQGSNAAFPLLIFPLLLSRIGVKKFSEVVLSESIIMILLAVIIYSFDIIGVRDINLAKSITEKLKIYKKIFLFRFNTYLIIQGALFIIWIVTGFDVILHVNLWGALLLGMLLQANYFYLSLTINYYLACIVFVTRAIGIVALYYYVDNSLSTELIILFLSSIYLISGIMSFVFVLLKYEVPKEKLSVKEYIVMFKDGFNILISNLSVVLFRGSNVIILSIIATPSAVSFYSVAEKIIKSVQALLNPLNQMGLSNFSNKMSLTNGQNIKSTLWACTKSQFYISVLIIFSLILISIVMLPLYFEKYFFSEIHILTMIMSCSVIFGVLNYMYGLVGLNILGYSRAFARSVLITGIISLALSIFLSHLFQAYGAAFAYLFGELFLFILVFDVIRKIEPV